MHVKIGLLISSIYLSTGSPDIKDTWTAIEFRIVDAVSAIHDTLNHAPLLNLGHLSWDVELLILLSIDNDFPDGIHFPNLFNKLGNLERLELFQPDIIVILRNRFLLETPLHFPRLRTLTISTMGGVWWQEDFSLLDALGFLGQCIRNWKLSTPVLHKVIFTDTPECGESHRRLRVDAICAQRSVSAATVRVTHNSPTTYAYLIPDGNTYQVVIRDGNDL